ncbi:MAG: hypothetical protein PSX79_08820 [bacterium]|nr:hypothetical protein [bacterium]
MTPSRLTPMMSLQPVQLALVLGAMTLRGLMSIAAPVGVYAFALVAF